MGIDADSGPGHGPRSVLTGDMIEFKAFERDGLWHDVCDCYSGPDPRAEYRENPEKSGKSGRIIRFHELESVALDGSRGKHRQHTHHAPSLVI